MGPLPGAVKHDPATVLINMCYRYASRCQGMDQHYNFSDDSFVYHYILVHKTFYTMSRRSSALAPNSTTSLSTAFSRRIFIQERGALT